MKADRCVMYEVLELAPGSGASASRPNGVPSAFAPHARPYACTMPNSQRLGSDIMLPFYRQPCSARPFAFVRHVGPFTV